MGWTFLGSHEKIITNIIAISGQRFPTIFNPIKTCRNMYDFLTFKANGFGVTSAEDSCLLVRSPVNVGGPPCERGEALRCLVSPALGKIHFGTHPRGKRHCCGLRGGPAESGARGVGQ